MQQDDYQQAMQREKTHAKLFTVGHRQVLAFLHRDDSDALVVILQLWIGARDEQLQVCIRVHDDEYTQVAFDALNDESVALVLDELDVPKLIAEIEDDGA